MYCWCVEIEIKPIDDCCVVHRHIEEHLGVGALDRDKVSDYYGEQLLTIVLDHKSWGQVVAVRDEMEKKVRRLGRGKPRFKLIDVRARRWYWLGYG